MTVTLTSFRRYHEAKKKPPLAYSIAVTQPKGYDELPTLSLFDIRDSRGHRIRIRDFVEDGADDRAVLKAYYSHLLDIYQRRFEYERNLGQLGFRLAEMVPLFQDDAALCCWCPYTRAAEAQLARFGSFVCHSMVVETFLRRGGLEVKLDADRERMMVKL